MSTDDNEPRYGRRLPEGQPPTPYGQSGGQPPQHGQPGPYEQSGQPSQYGQPGPSGHQGQPSQGGPGQYGQPPYGQPQQGQPPQYAPAGQYGQPPHAQPPQYGAPGQYGRSSGGRAPRRTGPVITIVIAVLLMIGGPIVGIGVAIASAGDSFDDIATDGTSITNGESADLPANVERAVIFEASSIEPGSVGCQVTDPRGADVATSNSAGDIAGVEDLPLPGVTFETTASGSYTIDCDLPDDVSQNLIVSPPLDWGALIGGGMAVLVGLAVGFLGLVALVIGIIWLVRVNKRIRTGQY